MIINSNQAVVTQDVNAKSLQSAADGENTGTAWDRNSLCTSKIMLVLFLVIDFTPKTPLFNVFSAECTIGMVVGLSAAKALRR